MTALRSPYRILAIAAVLLAGCGTSPPANYYTLTPADIPYSPDTGHTLTLGIGPLRVPEYLQRPQMVTRRENSRLQVDDFNRWAEPIAEAQYRIIAINVDALLPGVVVIAFPYGKLADYDYRMVGRVARFDMDHTGRTVLDVHWGITRPDETIVVAPTRSRFTSIGGDPDDPGSVAAAMDDCLEQFSRAIAEQFAAGISELDPMPAEDSE